MHIRDRIVVITGAASGIGKALAQRFDQEGARLVVSADLDGDGARATAKETGGAGFATDVSKEEDIQHLIESVEKDHGPIDLFFSNAGIGYGGGAEVSNERWDRIWDVNVMAHVWAARIWCRAWRHAAAAICVRPLLRRDCCRRSARRPMR
ncbi:MAG: SDR family NAD(P)-dependent oxidoreductase [Rhizomicrobium sp.]